MHLKCYYRQQHQRNTTSPFYGKTRSKNTTKQILIIAKLNAPCLPIVAVARAVHAALGILHQVIRARQTTCQTFKYRKHFCQTNLQICPRMPHISLTGKLLSSCFLNERFGHFLLACIISLLFFFFQWIKKMRNIPSS